MNEQVEVVVGAIGKAHGIRGDVIIDVRTDEPERRFVDGAQLRVEGTSRTLTLSRSSWHSGKLLAHFDQIADRNAAEAARGWVLVCDVDVDEMPSDEDEYYDRQLVGLRAVDRSGDLIGVVSQVIHLPAQDLLAIDVDGVERLVPFVTELVPNVDLSAGTVTIDQRPGLLDDDAETSQDDDGEPDEPQGERSAIDSAQQAGA